MLSKDRTTREITGRPPKAERRLICEMKMHCCSFCRGFFLFSDTANKTVATQKIEDDLLLAANIGRHQLDEFVEERLLPHEKRNLAFRDTLPKNKYLAFSSLFDMQQTDVRSRNTVTDKTDKNILQRCTAVPHQALSPRSFGSEPGSRATPDIATF